MSISPCSHISDSLATPADPRVWHHQHGFPWLEGCAVPPTWRAAAVLPRGILPCPPPQPQGFPFRSVPLRARFLKYLLFQEGLGCLDAAELRSVFAFALSAFPKPFSHRATQRLSPLARTLLFPRGAHPGMAAPEPRTWGPVWGGPGSVNEDLPGFGDRGGERRPMLAVGTVQQLALLLSLPKCSSLKCSGLSSEDKKSTRRR